MWLDCALNHCAQRNRPLAENGARRYVYTYAITSTHAQRHNIRQFEFSVQFIVSIQPAPSNRYIIIVCMNIWAPNTNDNPTLIWRYWYWFCGESTPFVVKCPAAPIPTAIGDNRKISVPHMYLYIYMRRSSFSSRFRYHFGIAYKTDFDSVIICEQLLQWTHQHRTSMVVGRYAAFHSIVQPIANVCVRINWTIHASKMHVNFFGA